MAKIQPFQAVFTSLHRDTDQFKQETITAHMNEFLNVIQTCNSKAVCKSDAGVRPVAWALRNQLF